MCPKFLPPDSVLYAPVYQEEQLEQLYQKLRDSSHPEATILKEKLIEKAKETLRLPYLPNSPTISPFFHFDEFEDVYLSFLQHSPPYSPWFSIMQTYFGTQTLELHRSVYSILLEHAKNTQRDSVPDVHPDHDFFIEVDFANRSDRPSFKIKPSQSAKPDNYCPASMAGSQETMASSQLDEIAQLSRDQPFWISHEDMESSEDSFESDLGIPSNFSRGQPSSRTMPNCPSSLSSDHHQDPREQLCSSSNSSLSNSCNPSNASDQNTAKKRENIDLKANVLPESNFVESKRRASRPSRYSDFIPL